MTQPPPRDRSALDARLDVVAARAEIAARQSAAEARRLNQPDAARKADRQAAAVKALRKRAEG